MLAMINEEISVLMYYSVKKKKLVPYRLNWGQKSYELGKVDYYHNYMEGQERQHIFELCDVGLTLKFRLRMNSLNLHWILEGIHDGNPD